MPTSPLIVLALLLGRIEYLALRVIDLEDQVAAARDNVIREQDSHQLTRLAKGGA